MTITEKNQVEFMKHFRDIVITENVDDNEYKQFRMELEDPRTAGQMELDDNKPYDELGLSRYGQQVINGLGIDDAQLYKQTVEYLKAVANGRTDLDDSDLESDLLEVMLEISPEDWNTEGLNSDSDPSEYIFNQIEHMFDDMPYSSSIVTRDDQGRRSYESVEVPSLKPILEKISYQILNEDVLDDLLARILRDFGHDEWTAAEFKDILDRIMNSPTTSALGDHKKMIRQLEDGFENEQLNIFRDNLAQLALDNPEMAYVGSDLHGNQVARKEYNDNQDTAVADTAGETDTGDGSNDEVEMMPSDTDTGDGSNDEVEMEPDTDTAVVDTAGETDTGDGSNDEVEMADTEKDYSWDVDDVVGRDRARTGPLADVQGNETDAGFRASMGLDPATDYAGDEATLARLQAQQDAEAVADADTDAETNAVTTVEPENPEPEAEVARVDTEPTPEPEPETEPVVPSAAEKLKAELAARREAMKQAWLHNDLSKITHPDDLKKAQGMWSERAGGFTSGGPMRIAGEEPNLWKYAQGYRINQDTGQWEKKATDANTSAKPWVDPNKQKDPATTYVDKDHMDKLKSDRTVVSKGDQAWTDKEDARKSANVAASKKQRADWLKKNNQDSGHGYKKSTVGSASATGGMGKE